MKTCLVVDDLEIRHNGFKSILGNKAKLLRADNVTEATVQFHEMVFGEERPIDVIFLDHDIDSGFDKRDVIHFVNWLMDTDWAIDSLRKWGTTFFIHSHNPVGAGNMRKALEDNGFTVKVKPFEV